MPVKVLMPALSPTMKSGAVTKWLKKEGDKVETGDIIAEIETDKAIMEFEYSDECGVLYKILEAEGSSNVPVNKLIAIVQVGNEAVNLHELLETSDDTTQAPSVASTSASPVEGNQVPAPASSAAAVPVDAALPHLAEGSRVKASPLAKKLAASLSVDISNIKGSGPGGRVVKVDVLSATSSASNSNISSGTETFVEISSMRRVIAERLMQSKRDVPHFYLAVDCMVGELLATRAKLNSGLESLGVKVTVNDLIIKAVALSMRDFPEINSSWCEDKILVHRDVDVSFAVSIDDGLITPVVRSADKVPLSELCVITKTLATKAKERSLKPHEFQGGGITVSNLGMFGIKEFYAIINPPQSCIVSVGASEKRAVVIDGSVVPADVMTTTLSVDHRIVDGVLAAKFLNRLKFYIENPLPMMAR